MTLSMTDLPKPLKTTLLDMSPVRSGGQKLHLRCHCFYVTESGCKGPSSVRMAIFYVLLLEALEKKQLTRQGQWEKGQYPGGFVLIHVVSGYIQ